MFKFLEAVSLTEAEIKKGVADGAYLDYMVKDGQYFVTLMSTLKEDMEKVRNSSIIALPTTTGHQNPWWFLHCK